MGVLLQHGLVGNRARTVRASPQCSATVSNKDDREWNTLKWSFRIGLGLWVLFVLVLIAAVVVGIATLIRVVW